MALFITPCKIIKSDRSVTNSNYNPNSRGRRRGVLYYFVLIEGEFDCILLEILEMGLYI